MNNYIVEKLESASALSEGISDEADAAKRALAGLMTDKDRNDIYNDLFVLMTALDKIMTAADLIECATEHAKSEFEKEDHN